MEKVKQALETEAVAAELILIDPKDKPSPENETKIADFCNQL